MEFDLTGISTDDLRRLNHTIVNLLKDRRRIETQKVLSGFCVGDHVAFDDCEDVVRGYVVRVNQKTISIDAYDPPGNGVFLPGVFGKSSIQVSRMIQTFLSCSADKRYGNSAA